MKYIKFLLIFMMIAMISCKEKKSFVREKQIFHFLEQYNSNKENGVFIFFQNGNCGSCVEESFDFINNILNKDELLIIFKTYDEVLVSKLSSDVKYLVDTKELSTGLGLDFPKDLYMEVKSNEIDYWGWLYQQEIKEIVKMYEKTNVN